MSNLKKAFEKILSKYEEKRPKFVEIVENWAGKKTQDMHNLGKSLIAEADQIIQDLKHLDEETIIREKIYRFKKVYKQLYESTKPQWRQWLEAISFALVAVFVLRNFVFGLYHVPSGSAEPTLLVGDRVFGNKLAFRFGDKPKYGDLVMLDNPLFKYDTSNSIKYFWQKYAGFPILGLPVGPDNWVKRVIALPGDTIEGKVEEGRTVIYRNGERLHEPYVNPYPLIALEKRVGLLDIDNIGPIPMPSFIRSQKKIVFYTYDADKAYDEQPFYTMNPTEIVFEPGTRKPWLRFPFTSTHEYGKVVDSFGPFKLPQGKYWVMGDSRKNSTDSRSWLFLDENLIQGRASFIIYSIDSEEPFWFFDLIKHPIEFWTRHMRWNRIFKGISRDNSIIK